MDEPHPKLTAMLEEAEELGIPPKNALSVPAARRQHVENATREGGPAVDQTWELEIDSPVTDDPMSVRVYRPGDDGPYPTLVWIHGGGFVAGNLETTDPVARSLAVETDCVVVSVGYHRAPEHPFPGPPEECYAALEWATEFASTFGGDPDRLAVGGDSAGGNLAAVTALLARDRDGPALDHQLLVYPVTTDEDLVSRAENGTGYGLTIDEMAWYEDKYVPDPIDAANPYAYPLKARDLSGLPPATVVTAGFDPLRDDGERYADRLADAGVPVEYREYEDMIHGFFGMLAEPELAAAHDAIEWTGANLRAAFEE